MNGLRGLAVVENPNLVVPVQVKRFRQVPRTWRERLLGRPWRPWQATKLQETEETEWVPDQAVYVVDGRMVCHPEVARKISEAMEDRMRNK